MATTAHDGHRPGFFSRDCAGATIGAVAVVVLAGVVCWGGGADGVLAVAVWSVFLFRCALGGIVCPVPSR